MSHPESRPPARTPRFRELLRSERGLTLTELTVIGVLAIMVMLALTGFYLNAQRLWVEGSTQALAQRDATMLIEVLRARTHGAKEAAVDTADPEHHSLVLTYQGAAPTVQFRWHSEDSRVHLEVGADDQGAVVESPVDRFQLSTVGNSLVELTLLEIRTTDGDTIRVSSRFGLLGRSS